MLIFKTTQTASKLGYNVEVQNRFAQQCCPLCKKDLNARFRVLANNFFSLWTGISLMTEKETSYLKKREKKRKRLEDSFFFFFSISGIGDTALPPPADYMAEVHL